jgi:hypothetical protein
MFHFQAPGLVKENRKKNGVVAQRGNGRIDNPLFLSTAILVFDSPSYHPKVKLAKQALRG